MRMSTEQRIDALEQRIGELEAQIDESQGSDWGVETFRELGLGRREALVAAGAVAAGYTVREAILSGIGYVGVLSILPVARV